MRLRLQRQADREQKRSDDEPRGTPVSQTRRIKSSPPKRLRRNHQGLQNHGSWTTVFQEGGRSRPRGSRGRFIPGVCSVEGLSELGKRNVRGEVQVKTSVRYMQKDGTRKHRQQTYTAFHRTLYPQESRDMGQEVGSRA